MYDQYPIQHILPKTEKALNDAAIHGVSVYVESDPEYCGADIYIDPQDEAGIAIFREFSQKMAEHFKKLSS